MEQKENKKKLYSKDEKNCINTFCDEYIKFLSACKTEREVNSFLQSVITSETNSRVFLYNCNNKGTVALYIGDYKSLSSDGLNIIGAHIDSPRLDLKQKPLYEKSGLAYFDTHYYGGIKKYQWATLPLAIHGVICKTSGETVDVVIGEEDYDPVFVITDLLPHLDKGHEDKKSKDLFDGEKLDIVIGSVVEEENKSLKESIINILISQEYIDSEEDFLSAELEVVPAGKARSLGLDSSMVLAYGQDDRVCAYTATKAFCDMVKNNTNKNICLILTDKEEIGSVGATGMQSEFYINAIRRALLYYEISDELNLYTCLEKSHMLSSDVNAAYDPQFSSAYDEKNATKLNNGISFCKFTGARGKSGSNDANPEFIAKLRKCMNDNNIQYQFAELGKVDQGGGGTIAYIMANKGVNVIDAGVGVLNMHAPYEVTSKIDIWETFKAYKAFYKYSF